jgi:dihydrofolate synthase/folylpolyglutamate synthase
MNQESLYTKNINKLMSLTNFEYEKSKNNPPGFHLDRVNYMMKKFGYPNKNQIFIHVAGSKGKGSTSNLISQGLSSYKVGLFTSPHMHTVTERIKINNNPVSKKIFNKYFKKVWIIVQTMKKELSQRPSFFEFMTLLSLVIFRDEKVELSIIEVGLGGRLDSTNVIDSSLSVITQISKDHTEILGNTLEKIALEKAGIIKKEIPVVTSNQTKNAFEVIKLTAKKYNSNLYSSNEVILNKKNKRSENKSIQHLVFLKKHSFTTSLLGNHQIENIKTALKAIEVFFALKSKKANWEIITNSISKTQMIGRCQIIKDNQITLVIDGAQNNQSTKALINVLKSTIKELSEIIWIYGASEGHNSIETLKPIKKFNPKIIITESRLPKAKKSEKIVEEIKDLELNIIELNKDSFEAYKKAKNMVNKNGVIVAFGSLYIASEIIEIIENITPEKYNYG